VLLRLIGSGSSGQVWLARNALGTYRAVKIVQKRMFRHQRPFEREFNGILKFEPVSRLHDGLVDILQVGRSEAGGYFYCVMELADDVITGSTVLPATYSPRTLEQDKERLERLPVAECVRLGAAVAYLRRIGLPAIHRHSQELGRHLVERLRTIPHTEILADSVPFEQRIGLATFVVKAPGLGQESVARLLCDRHQILVSGGYHCAHILHHRLHLEGTVRASTHVFNTLDDIDRLIGALQDIVEG